MGLAKGSKKGGSVCLLDYPVNHRRNSAGALCCMKLGPIPVEPGGSECMISQVYPLDDPVGAASLKRTLEKIRVAEDSPSRNGGEFSGIPWKTGRFLVYRNGQPMESGDEGPRQPEMTPSIWHGRTWPGFSEKRSSDY